MGKGKPTISARFDPDPTHIVLTEIEFQRVCETARTPEKENLFLLVGLLVPCAINAYVSAPKDGAPASTEFLLNIIVVVVAVLVAGFQARAWYAKRSSYNEFVEQLRERPEGRLSFSQPQGTIYVSNAPVAKDG
jgi:hypothetical protein